MSTRPAPRALRSNTALLRALFVLLLLASSTAPAEPSPDPEPTAAGVASATEWPAIWRAYVSLESRIRVRQEAASAFALAARLGQPLTDFNLERLTDLLNAAEYERDPARRTQAQQELAAKLASLAEGLLGLLPPVAAFDRPDDDGRRLIVMWRPVPGASGYVLERRARRPGGEPQDWRTLGSATSPGATDVIYEDDRDLRTDRLYEYRLSARFGDGPEARLEPLGQTPPIRPVINALNTKKLAFYVFMTVICAAVVIYIGLAQRGVQLKIRRIAGLEAVDEAVGRATEMGRPVMFLCGTQDVDNIQTVAGLTVLGRVARVAAEHDAALEVPTNRALVMTAARETVSAAYLNAGRSDAFDDKRIYYVTEEQFGFVAGVTGIIVRKQPAACVYMGAFFAESLILAETANTIGSIQIAGTAEPAQLPFFVAACDYTLMGEEFFAASAYLSGEPRQLGSLKGQDLGKAIVMLFLLVGVSLATLETLGSLRYGWAGEALAFMREVILQTSD